MRRIYHLVPRRDWERQPTVPYRVASLDSEGFIHCSNRDQVLWVANQFYAPEPDLLLLTIATELLTSPLRDDDIGGGQCFPHVYGPIERAAVIEVQPMRRDAQGRWDLPDGTFPR